MTGIDPQIIIAALTGEATEDERRRLERWRAQSSDNERAFRRWARVWTVSGEFLADADDPPVPSASEIVRRAEARRQPSGEDRTARDVVRRRRWMAAAAILVIGLGLGAVASLTMRGAPLRPRTLETGIGEVATVTLEDETVVHLAPESRLEFGGGGNERGVTLFGRAYFAVTSDPSHPFRVRLPNGTVQVLGTRFDVDSRGEEVRVAVVEGVVEMESDGGRARVEANQLGVASGDDTPTVQTVEDVFDVIDWLGRFLAFESTPLSEVALEIEHRVGLHIEIADSVLARRTVTGWFGDQAPEELLDGICAAVAAHCSVEGDSVRVEPLSR